MITRKKSLLQSIPLGAKLLIGFMLLSVGLAMLGGSEAPVETGLWIFIGVVVAGALTLVVAAMIISFRKRPKPKKAEDKPAGKPPEASGEAHATPALTKKKDDHGHGGHMSNGQSWLYWSIGFLVFILTVLAFGFGLKALLGLGPARNSDARPVASAALRAPQTEWFYVDVPPSGSDWYTISSLPGYTMQVCTPTTDPNCSDPIVRGVHTKCTDSAGYEHEWTAEACKVLNSYSIQSATGNPLRIKWKERPKGTPPTP